MKIKGTISRYAIHLFLGSNMKTLVVLKIEQFPIFDAQTQADRKLNLLTPGSLTGKVGSSVRCQV